jgi:hypothetical protein
LFFHVSCNAFFYFVSYNACSFRNLLYDYLKKSGLSNTAESLQNEAQITGQIPPGMSAFAPFALSLFF